MIISNLGGLGKWSNVEIDVICDCCGIDKKIKYKLYTSYGYSNGEYLCRNCKLKKNNIEKYGVDNVFQLDSVKDKIKKTTLDRYGVDNVSKLEYIKNKKIETNIEKYGVEHYMKKKESIDTIRKNNIEKYGVDNVSKLDWVHNKKIETSISNNGYAYITQDEKHRERIKNENNEKYGVDFLFQSTYFKEKSKLTNIEKYGVDNPSKSEIIKDKIKTSNIETSHKKILNENKNIQKIDSVNRLFEIYCDTCNTNFMISYMLFYKRRETNTIICTNCNKVVKHQSGKEIMLSNYIKSIYSGEILENHRIDNKELDIYLPNENIAIEFNGLYWHSELYKGRNYHKMKTDMCQINNIQLIHIWEDDWDNKQNIIKSFISNKLKLNVDKIGSRKCIVKEIDDILIVKKFLNENHIQGYVRSTIKIGLYYNDVLVSIMCFLKNGNVWDLNRFCNKLNTTVQGSASKLLKYFVNNYSDEITTFSDNSYSYGDVYEKIGFYKLYEIKPDYHYIKDNIRIHKFNFRKTVSTGLYKIYDSGKIKYKYKQST
jgi:hypothetical protein